MMQICISDGKYQECVYSPKEISKKNMRCSSGVTAGSK